MPTVDTVLSNAGYNKVVCLLWEESERGWGCRPDGYSLHHTPSDMEAYIRQYNASRQKAVPDEYDRPCSSHYFVYVSDEAYLKITGYGIRKGSGKPQPNEILENV